MLNKVSDVSRCLCPTPGSTEAPSAVLRRPSGTLRTPEAGGAGARPGRPLAAAAWGAAVTLRNRLGTPWTAA